MRVLCQFLPSGPEFLLSLLIPTIEMSQATFLEEVLSWNEEKRQEKVDEALPQLIYCLQNHNTYEEALGILQILCHSFVPLVPQEHLEEKVFEKLSQQACQLLDDVLEEIHTTWKSKNNSLMDHLVTLHQHISGVLECLEKCAYQVAGLSDTVHFSSVRSLPHGVLHLLKRSYRHCQESSDLFADVLPVLSESLSGIFRRAHSLQMAFLNMLEKIAVLNSASEDVFQDIIQVCEGLFSLCQLVACLDLKLTLTLWRGLSKLTNQYQQVLCPHLDINSMVSYLCGEIQSGTISLLQSAPSSTRDDSMNLSQSDEKAFTKSLKILSFQMKILVALVRDYHDYLGTSEVNVYDLLLHINSVLPPCLTAPRLQSKHEDGFRQQVWNATQPLTSHLLHSQVFRECVLGMKESPEKKCLPRLLLQITIMDCISQMSVDVMSLWLENPSPDGVDLLSSIFTSLECCHVEISLPLYMPCLPKADQSARMISLYQFVLEHLCAFAGICPAKNFYLVEKSLLSALLNSHPISSLAAADLWCFVARYGTADLCWQHVRYLVSLCQEVIKVGPLSYSCSSLTSLISRLVRFLTPEQQAELLDLFPADDNIGIWASLSLDGLSPRVLASTTEALLSYCLKSLHTFLELSRPTLSDAATVLPVMKCLESILHCHSAARYLSHTQRAVLIDHICHFWQLLPIDQSFLTGQEHDIVHLYLASLLRLTATIVDQLDTKVLLHVLLIANKALSSCSNGDLAMAVVHLLQNMGPVKIPPSFEQGQILRKTADTFAMALSHKAAPVEFAALKAFTRFAEQTSYEAIVPECLAFQSGLQEKMIAFLKKTPLNSDGQDKMLDLVSYLRCQKQSYKAKTSAKFCTETDATSSRGSQLLPHKRPRCDDIDQEIQTTDSYLVPVTQLEAITSSMELLARNGQIPDWVVARCKPLLHRLSVCLESR